MLSVNKFTFGMYMKPGFASLLIFVVSLIIYALFRALLNAEVAAVALSTIPALLTIWLQPPHLIGAVSASRPKHIRSNFSNFQIAALFAAVLVAVWGLAFLFLFTFNLAVSDLIKSNFLQGTEEGFDHLQIYVVGLGVMFMWLPLLCVFGGYVGPRSSSAAYWPYLVGLLITIFAFSLMRFAFVDGSYKETMEMLKQVVNLDLGYVPGGRYIALGALMSGFALVLLVLSGLPWLVSRIRRRVIYGRSERSLKD